MNISEALSHCTDGFKITRKVWDRSSFVAFQKGYPDGIEINANTAEATGIPEGTKCVFAPYFLAFSKGVFFPWQPGQDDLTAMDWKIVA